jgi:hypothetical protein
MQRKLFLSLLALFVIPGLVFAQNGKIRGKVTDRETGEALIGATVALEGTTLGASSDINGEYIILNVAPGSYTVKATYVGYAPVSISGVVVYAAQTTTVDVALPPTSVQVEPVSIIAERPLVQRNTPNTIRITSREDIGSLPIRGTQQILALDAGVVRQDGNLYVRGGRSGDLAYFVDGANVTNRLFNTEGVSVIQEAFQELQFQPGGYTAEFGGANSGIAKTTVRTGGNKFNFSLDYRTDDFAKPGDQFLQTSSFGFRNAVVTLGGPVDALKMRYFFAGQHNYLRSPARWVFPFQFDSVTTAWPGSTDAQPGRLLPGPIALRQNYLGTAWDFTNTGQGTLLFNFDPVSLKVTGSYSFRKTPNATDWPNNLTNLFNLNRQRMNETNTYFLNARATHAINPETFYEVGLSYYNRKFESFDPRFGSDWIKYPDSLANSAFEDTKNWVRRYRGPNPYIVAQGFSFSAPNAPNNAYQINSQRSIEGTIDFVSQLTKKWEFKAGGRLEAWLMRAFIVGNIATGLEALNGIYGNSPKTYASEAERRVDWAKAAGVNNYGYDVYGNKVDGDVTAQDAPKKPIFASAYFQNKLEYNDLVINFGLRYEYFNPRTRAFNDPINFEQDFDTQLDVIKESQLQEGPKYQYVLPRLNFSFPVTDRTVFYAQYGKYVQMPRLTDFYRGFISASATVSSVTRGFAFLPPIGFMARPERLTQYEMGFRQAITDFASLTISGFYKDTKDQLAVRRFTDAQGNALYIAWLNEDFETAKGLEFTLDVRRIKRLTARVNYTLQDVRGTGANQTQSFGVVERQDIGRFPSFIFPLDYNQTHRGSIMVDYRFAKGDGGPILEGLGAFLLFTFNSGHAYTKIKEPSDLGQASPYNIGVRYDIDSRSRFPVQAINSSATPSILNIDLTVSKAFFLRSFTVELYANVLNLLNSKQAINVYPNTGTTEDDGWLRSPLGQGYVNNISDPKARQQYVDFYKAFNLQNRWHYATRDFRSGAVSNDLYGSPRQIRVGLKLEY